MKKKNNQSKAAIAVVIICLAILGVYAFSGVGSDYPSTLKHMDRKAKLSLNVLFEKAHPELYVCGQGFERRPMLDRYGYLDRACAKEQVEKNEITEEMKAGLIAEAEAWLIQNRKYTGLPTSTKSLEVASIKEITKRVEGDGPRPVVSLHVEFEPQQYRGLTVEGHTRPLMAILHTGGMTQIGGHWWPKIDAPTTPKVNEEKAKKKLDGAVVEYTDPKGKKLEKEINKKNISDMGLVVFFNRLSGEGEWRLAWKVAVDDWFVYLDAINGELLEGMPQDA